MGQLAGVLSRSRKGRGFHPQSGTFGRQLADISLFLPLLYSLTRINIKKRIKQRREWPLEKGKPTMAVCVRVCAGNSQGCQWSFGRETQGLSERNRSRNEARGRRSPRERAPGIAWKALSSPSHSEEPS